MAESFDPATKKISEVKKHLKKNPDQLQAVLDAEKARGKDARVTLVRELEEEAAKRPQFANSPAQTVAPGAADGGEQNKTVRVGGQEYTVDPDKGYRLVAGADNNG